MKLKGVKPATNQEVVLQHQVQQSQEGENPWRQAGLPVPEEAAVCPQVSDDWYEAEGSQASHEPGEDSSVQTPEDRLQGLRWSLEPQGRQGENCPRFPDRGTEDRYESAEGPGQEGLRCLLQTLFF